MPNAKYWTQYLFEQWSAYAFQDIKETLQYNAVKVSVKNYFCLKFSYFNLPVQFHCAVLTKASFVTQMDFVSVHLEVLLTSTKIVVLVA